MEDFASWLAWILLYQRIHCEVNGLYPRAGRGNFSPQFELQSSFQKNRKELIFSLSCLETVGHRATQGKNGQHPGY